MVCDRSAWISASPMMDKSAESTLIAMLNDWILKFGPMNRLRTDQGSEFDAELSRLAYASWGIRFKTSSSHHPESQGRVESRNKGIKSSLKKLLLEFGVEWDVQLPQVLYFMNISPVRFRNLSAFEILFGRRATLPLDMQIHLEKGEQVEDPELMDKFLVKRFNLFKVVKKHLDTSFQQHSNRIAEKYSRYKVGDLVGKRTFDGEGLDPPFKGPYEVLEVVVNSLLLKSVSGRKDLLRVSWRDV